MKTKLTRLMSLLAATLMLVVAGCATSRETTTIDLLKRAGFKAMLATTFEKQQHLKTIKADRISSVKTAGGQLFYVYPLHGKNMLYVGKAAEYATYQNLRQNLQSEEATLKAERSTRSDVSWTDQVESGSSWSDVWSAPADE